MDRQTPEYFAKVDLENERHYRSLAAESRDSVNVALFTEKANFYAQQAASRQPPTPVPPPGTPPMPPPQPVPQSAPPPQPVTQPSPRPGPHNTPSSAV